MENTVEQTYLESNEGETWQDIEGVPTLVDMDLDKIAWVLRKNNKEIAQFQEDLEIQINKLTECTQRRIDMIEANNGRLTELAKNKMNSLGIKSKHYPGVGKLWLGKSSKSVSTKLYDESTPEEREQMQRIYKDLFKSVTKTVISPDKKAIKTRIENEGETPLFYMQGGHEILKFKEE